MAITKIALSFETQRVLGRLLIQTTLCILLGSRGILFKALLSGLHQTAQTPVKTEWTQI